MIMVKFQIQTEIIQGDTHPLDPEPGCLSKRFRKDDWMDVKMQMSVDVGKRQTCGCKFFKLGLNLPAQFPAGRK